MTGPQPSFTPTPPPPAPPRVPLVDRVSELEDRLTQLLALYNHFVDDVTTELGL